MKILKTECIMCEEELVYTDPKERPEVCYRRECRSNLEYQKGHTDPLTGKKAKIKDIKKWT